MYKSRLKTQEGTEQNKNTEDSSPCHDNSRRTWIYMTILLVITCLVMVATCIHVGTLFTIRSHHTECSPVTAEITPTEYGRGRQGNEAPDTTLKGRLKESHLLFPPEFVSPIRPCHTLGCYTPAMGCTQLPAMHQNSMRWSAMHFPTCW